MTAPISVAVVGGTGFLGTVIVDQLERSGADVTVVSRRAEPIRTARAGPDGMSPLICCTPP